MSWQLCITGWCWVVLGGFEGCRWVMVSFELVVVIGGVLIKASFMVMFIYFSLII